MITILQVMAFTFAFSLLVCTLSSSVLLTYEIATSIFTTSYHPTHMTTRVSCLICAVVWDALLFTSAYFILLTVLVDFDSLGST